MTGVNLNSIWCVVPVYNNAASISEVVKRCLAILPNVLVVDDGSTDADLSKMLAESGARVVRHEKNFGKGRAILTALDFAAEKSADWIITIDGDGQHMPEDLSRFLPLMAEDENSLIVGCRNFSAENIPGKSRFGRKFANFWLRLETGVSVDDCQSGFRAYPVRHFKEMNLSGSYYDFETEALARAAWAGLNLKTVEVNVYYPESGQRVTSFRPFMDNLRISLMHTKLVLRHLVPFPHRKLVKKEPVKRDLSLFLHPVKFIKMLMHENASPEGLAASAAAGIILGTLPLIFTHTLAILYVTSRLHLNKIMGISIQNICNPPVVPFLCIELGHRMRCGEWLTSVSPEAFLGQVPSLLWDWLLGSLLIAPVLAAAGSAAVYFISKQIQQKNPSVLAPVEIS